MRISIPAVGLSLAALLALSSLTPDGTATAGDKIDVCHYDATTGAWSLLNLSINGASNHLANHDDVEPGGTTGSGTTLDASCAPAPPPPPPTSVLECDCWAGATTEEMLVALSDDALGQCSVPRWDCRDLDAEGVIGDGTAYFAGFTASTFSTCEDSATDPANPVLSFSANAQCGQEFLDIAGALRDGGCCLSF